MKIMRKSLLLGLVVVTTASASWAASEVTVSIPVIDTNVPLYVLADIPYLNTNPLGMSLTIR